MGHPNLFTSPTSVSPSVLASVCLVFLGDDPRFQQSPEILGLLDQVLRLQAAKLQHIREFGVECGQSQPVLDLFADPLVIGKGIGAVSDEETCRNS